MEFSCLPGLIYFSLSALIVTLVVYKTGFLSKVSKAITESSTYKKLFVRSMLFWNKQLREGTTFNDAVQPMFKQIEDRVLEIGGDVLEIGAGTGRSLDLLRLPEGSSFVVVDYNPFMEKAFRESLAKAPHINLKDYLVQSAADMSNIPDNAFAVVSTTDVMCSMEIEDLRKMLKEIKRVLKPGGCLYFYEHILDDPGTWRRTMQLFATSKTGIWPFFTDGCHCDRETLQYIKEAGFTSVTHRKTRSYAKNTQTEPLSLYLVNNFVLGEAKK